MIEIHDLQDLDLNGIEQLLAKELGESYELYIPKGTQRFFSDPANIAVEFVEAAYAGQKLSDVSVKFEYDSSTPDDGNDFYFRFIPKDKAALAEALLDISYIYVNDHPDPHFIAPEETEWLLQDIEEKKIIAACPDFIALYHEFMAESAAKEDDDEEEE